MSLPFGISLGLSKTLERLGRKDKTLATAVRKKIQQIVDSDISGIKHFKNLRYDSGHLKRVHIGSFVLTFQVKGDTIIFEDFVHHDDAYKR